MDLPLDPIYTASPRVASSGSLNLPRDCFARPLEKYYLRQRATTARDGSEVPPGTKTELVAKTQLTSGASTLWAVTVAEGSRAGQRGYGLFTRADVATAGACADAFPAINVPRDTPVPSAPAPAPTPAPAVSDPPPVPSPTNGWLILGAAVLLAGGIWGAHWLADHP